MIEYWLNKVKKEKEKGRSVWKIYYKIGKFIVNVFYPITQKYKKDSGIDPNGTVIISLTSFPKRIKTVWITIASLMNQTQRAKKIILWLAEEQFPDKKIPKSLKKLEKRGLEIKYCDEIKPHKKYFYTIKEYPADIVITADDDIFYPERHIEKLLAAYDEFPKTVICTWSHEIKFNEEGDFLPYNNWQNNSTVSPSYFILPVGCNGVLYPPYALNEEVFNKKKIKELALNTDDLWLKCMELLNSTMAINCERYPVIYFNNVFTQFSGLWKTNAASGTNRNDIVWKKLIKEYPYILKILKESEKKQ